ncbi:MAG: hypothetical protein HY361_01620, partial [Candidatus Aenigmarchaeota archaeon]|nr:hypothetical protein [Candidatus Aenigmarchaeota archaeon]
MYLSSERKREIEQSIDCILEPYGNLRYFTLEQVRDSLGIFKVGRSQAAIPGCHGQVFDVLGS